jgi:diguanylate cyclase (GGDEF)-like protein/PAS domain S-box-containing protein
VRAAGSFARIGTIVLLGLYAAAFAIREALSPPGVLEVTLLSNLGALPLGAAVVVLAWLRARSEHADPRLRAAWRWLFASFTAFWLGDVLFLALKLLKGSAPLGVSLADAVYLASYVIGFVGLVALRGGRPEGEGRSTLLLDAAIVAIGGAMIAWHVFLAPALDDPERAVVGLVALAYVVGDLVLLLGLAVVALRPLRGGLRLSLALLGAGFVLRMIADLLFWHDLLHGREGSAGASVLYVFGWWFLAAASLAPTRDGALPIPQRSAGFSPLPYVAAAVGYAVLLHVVSGQASADIAGLLVGGMALTVVVLARQMVAERSRARLAAERVTQANEARFRSLVQNASDIVLLIGPAGQIRYHTPSAERFIDLAGASLELRRLHDFVHPEDHGRLEQLLADATASPGSTPSAEWRLRWVDGGWRFVEVGAKSVPDDPHLGGGVILTLRSVHERKALEERLAYQAFHDPLTQLANRRLFGDRLEHALQRARRAGRPLTVLFIDLDDFKDVNDGFGHAAGDALLVEVSRRFVACVRSADTAARLGGDEFAVLVEEGDVGTAREIASRVSGALLQPFVVGRSEIVLSASIGIAGDSGSETAGDLLRNADVAMYRAKKNGKGQAVLFESGMQAEVRERLELEAELRVALERAELALVYQPIVALASGRVVGAEALLRWDHPRRGRLRPAEFIGAAEAAGVMPSLATWVVREACRCAESWPIVDDADHLPLVGVNVSPRLFSEPDFVKRVERVIAGCRIPPGRLVLEITERAAVEDAATAVAGMHRLRALGVRVAIDDFGSGYSSLSRLRDLPVDILKLDGLFVDGIATDPRLARLTSGILDLARALGKLVIAQGIERAEQAERLKEQGFELGQGYLYSAPLEPGQLGARFAADAAVRLS